MSSVMAYATIVAGVMNPVLGSDQAWHLGTLGTYAALSGLFPRRTAARLRAIFFLGGGSQATYQHFAQYRIEEIVRLAAHNWLDPEVRSAIDEAARRQVRHQHPVTD